MVDFFVQGRNIKKKKPTSGKGSASSGRGTTTKEASDDPFSPHPPPAPAAPRSSQRRQPKQQQQHPAAGGRSWLKQKWAVEEMSKTWLITPPLLMALLAMIVVAYERSVRIYNVIILKFGN